MLGFLGLGVKEQQGWGEGLGDSWPVFGEVLREFQGGTDFLVWCLGDLLLLLGAAPCGPLLELRSWPGP